MNTTTKEDREITIKELMEASERQFKAAEMNFKVAQEQRRREEQLLTRLEEIFERVQEVWTELKDHTQYAGQVAADTTSLREFVVTLQDFFKEINERMNLY